jgi:hypothetical protein
MNANTATSVIADVEEQLEAIHAELSQYPWTSPVAYGNWLAQTYFYVRRVTHVLAAAAARTSPDEGLLHNHLLSGITGEKDHDALAIGDLEDLGFRIENFREHPLTKAFYQTLFYMIDTAGPVAILGYFFVLEGLAGTRGEPIYQQLLKAYDGRAVSFVKEHVILDQEHYPSSLRLLERLDASQLRIVSDSTQLAGPLYRYMVATIKAEGAPGPHDG